MSERGEVVHHTLFWFNVRLDSPLGSFLADERLSLDVGCDYVAPSDWDEARKYEQNELLSS